MSVWVTYYHRTQPLTWGNNNPYGYACVSIKKELHWLGYNGSSGNIAPEKQVIGLQADEAIRDFQKDHKLAVDGVVGPNTARVLYHKRARAAEDKYGIPDYLFCKQKSLESSNDPAAIGSNGIDFGLAQINLNYHPDVTVAQAIDGEFALDWGASYLKSQYNQIKDWDGALAAYNQGLYYATRWVKAGKPASGGHVTAKGDDLYAVATRYVELVKHQLC